MDVSWPVVNVYVSGFLWWENELGVFVQNLAFLVHLTVVIQTEPTQHCFFIKVFKSTVWFYIFQFLLLSKIQHMLHDMHLPRSFFIYTFL